MPVDGIVPVTVNAWLTSNAVALTVGAAGAVSAECTVTVEEAPDVDVSDVVALSVTCNSNAYVFPAVNVLAATLHVSVAPPLAALPLFTAHCVAEA